MESNSAGVTGRDAPQFFIRGQLRVTEEMQPCLTVHVDPRVTGEDSATLCTYRLTTCDRDTTVSVCCSLLDHPMWQN